MLLYRAYLMENGHVWTAIDLTCTDDDDAKRRAANLSSGHDVELWQGDRKVARSGAWRPGFPIDGDRGFRLMATSISD
jgi:hypothetical protein